MSIAGLNKFVTFIIGQEEYGINISNVISIVKTQEITNFPQSPDFVRGIIHLRGEVILVIDLRIRLGMVAEDNPDENRLVITTIKDSKVAFIVDSARDVIDIPEEVISAVPLVLDYEKSFFLENIAKLDKRLILLLNADYLLESDEIREIESLIT